MSTLRGNKSKLPFDGFSEIYLIFTVKICAAVASWSDRWSEEEQQTRVFPRRSDSTQVCSLVALSGFLTTRRLLAAWRRTAVCKQVYMNTVCVCSYTEDANKVITIDQRLFPTNYMIIQKTEDLFILELKQIVMYFISPYFQTVIIVLIYHQYYYLYGFYLVVFFYILHITIIIYNRH